MPISRIAGNAAEGFKRECNHARTGPGKYRAGFLLGARVPQPCIAGSSRESSVALDEVMSLAPAALASSRMLRAVAAEQ